MSKLTRSLTLLFFLTGFVALAQTSVPLVPEQLPFADISVRFDADARRIVQQDVNALLANRQYWTAKLDRVALYFPMIESILIDEDVPADFKYLAVQESSLTPDAVSSSTAVGYWQFKRETATDHGLRVDDEIDERKSITASTRGAAKYLKKNNAQFNNWVASLYSYYLGAGGISKLIPPDWSYAREVTLDGRTDRYILRFFAHKVAIENALKFHQPGNRFALIEYPNGGGKTMQAIAEELNVDEFELRKYNRWVLGETVPADKTYVMAVPVPSDQINDVRSKIVSVSARKTPAFVQNDVGFPVLKRVTTSISSKNDPVLYEINGLPGIQAQAGDNAASLARKAKISLSSFLRYNDMGETDPIITGDVYYLAKKRKKALVPFHTVRDDETARSISQRYGIRLKKLMRYNRLDRVQKLVTGRVMWLRERRPANKPVEIINAPTPPVYDQTPTPPSRTADVAERNSTGSARPVTGMSDVPRTASERKLYQPKLVGGGVTPNDGTAEPATPPQPGRDRPATPPVEAAPSAVSSGRPVPATTSRSTDANGSQRIVIVRAPESAPSTTFDQPASVASSRPTYSTTPAPSPGTRATKPADPYASSRPAKPSQHKESESDEYTGPLEQQADGSLTVPATKAPPRPAAPAVVKTERSAPAETARPEKADAPSAPTVRSAPATSSVNRSATTHTVEPGQTYYSISRLYGLTVDELLTLNNRTTADPLRVGERLTVAPPAARSDAPAPATTGRVGETPAATYHTVAKGETLFGIARQYGIGMDQLREWNSLTEDRVKVGQKLKVAKQ